MFGERGDVQAGRRALVGKVLAWAWLLPLIVLCGFVIRFSVDVPWWDQWDLVPFLDGNPRSFGEWQSQHNEHRVLVPRLIMAALARASRWDVRWEMATTVGFAIGLVSVCGLFARRLLGRLTWELFALALLIFSLSQWENWLWGWQLQIELNALAVAIGIACLSSERLGPARFFAAIAAGLVAQYSFANGLLFWPLGLAVLLVQHRKGVWLAGWTLAGVSACTASFIGYRLVAHHPPLSLGRQLGGQLGFILVYLGAPLGPDHGIPVAAGIGAVGVVLFVGLNLTLRRRGKIPLGRLCGLNALALYAIGSAAVTSVGRLGFGLEFALASRYMTFSSLLWVANLCLASLVARETRDRVGSASRLVPVAVSLGAVLAASGVIPKALVLKNDQEQAREILLGDDVTRFGKLHSNADAVARLRTILRQRGLSVFRNDPTQGRR